MPRLAQHIDGSSIGAEQRGCQISLGQGDAARRLARTATSDGVVQVVAGVVIGQYRIGIVIATVHKNTHQRLVVGGGEGGGLAQRREVQRQRQGSARHRELA